MTAADIGARDTSLCHRCRHQQCHTDKGLQTHTVISAEYCGCILIIISDRTYISTTLLDKYSTPHSVSTRLGDIQLFPIVCIYYPIVTSIVSYYSHCISYILSSGKHTRWYEGNVITQPPGRMCGPNWIQLLSYSGGLYVHSTFI